MQSPGKHEFRHYFCSGCGHEIVAPVSCGNRFCPVCSVGPRLRARDRLLELTQKAREVCPDPLRMLTLTIRDVDDPAVGFRLLVDAFRRLRTRQLWRNRVRGGVYVVEATGHAGSWHVHLHAIIQGQFLPQRWISAQWKRLTSAPIVWINTVGSSRGAVMYLTQYLTKADVAADDLPVLSAALRGSRMFSPFGSWHCLLQKAVRKSFLCPCCGRSDWVHDRVFDKARPWDGFSP